MNLSRSSMQGRTCLITGASSGIGLITARELARQGAHVLLVGRNPAKTDCAVALIRSATGNRPVSSFVADLSSQEQVRNLARQVKDNHPALDVLVNNAGGIWARRQLTVDGIEMTVAVNYLAGFLLTNLLLDTLKAGRNARIVNVSSDAHRLAALDFDDLMAQRSYWPYPQYCRSKLMVTLFTYELARKLAGSGVTVNALHPGCVRTNIATDLGWRRHIFHLNAWLVRGDADKGAKNVVYLASAPEVAGISGQYFNKQKPVASARASYDEATAKRLWQVSLELTGQPLAPDRHLAKGPPSP